MARYQEIAGTIGSSGMALGETLRWTEFTAADYDPKKLIDGSGDRLIENAIEATASQLGALSVTVDDMARDILEFQIELLEEFTAPVLKLVEKGQSGFDAWTDYLDQEIESYDESGDEYLQARVPDLVDLRNRVLKVLVGHTPEVDLWSQSTPVILLAHDLSPSDFLSFTKDALAGIALVKGSFSSHVALLARSRGIPMLVGCGESLLTISDGQTAMLDGRGSKLIVNPHDIQLHQFVEEQAVQTAFLASLDDCKHEAGCTADGSRVDVCANIDDVSILSELDVRAFDGVGLVRSEFMFTGDSLPSEDTQFQYYKAIIEWAQGRLVTIRTLDAGGDKPIVGLKVEHETNPFLGVRGYRLSRTNIDVFKCQLRALARAAALGPMRVMIPMVTQPNEMAGFRVLFKQVHSDLLRRNIDCALPKLGMMIEIPAAALTAEQFDADFFSIGSNDLIQYTLAKSRDCSSLAYLSDLNDGVYKLISMSLDAARIKGVSLSICGDMASHAESLDRLLDIGVRSISITPGQVATVKDIIRRWSPKDPNNHD
jgi:phosphoenolpyruvate-protein phosphotransferase (PTS system enzyme I)